VKKKLIPLFICLGMLAGCGETVLPAQPTPTPVPTPSPSTAADIPMPSESKSPAEVNSEPEEPEDVVPALPDFFGGTFLHIENGVGREMSLEELYRKGTEQEMVHENRRFALVDLDGDGGEEVILSLAMGASEYPYGYEILHYSGEMASYPVPYAYPVVLRGLNDLCTDGTFTASSGAYDWEICKIESFDEAGFTTKALMGRSSASDENGEMVYSFFVGNEECTEEEFWAAFEAYYASAEQVEFYSLNMKKGESSFIAEDESEYTLSNGLKLGLSYEELKSLIGPPQMKETLELEVAKFHKLFYRGLGVLTLCSESNESIDEAELICIQILGKGIETARGIGVGADLQTMLDAGMEPSEENAVFNFCFPTIRSGDIMAYDGVVDFSNGLAGMEDGRHLFYMISEGLVESILIRPAVALDAFPPVYPPNRGDAYAVMDEDGREIEKIAIKRFSDGSENTLSRSQMLLLSELTWDTLSGEENGDYEITMHYADGGEKTFYQNADEEMISFLENHYRWSKYDLSFMDW